MSGGVDSAVAAARAVDAGHDVTGVHLALSRTPQALRSGSRGCCSREDAGDAQRAADVLGVPFYVASGTDGYYYDSRASRPLPVLRVRYVDEHNTWLYLDPQRGGIVQRSVSVTRLRRWLYQGFHSLDFPFVYFRRPLWDATVIVLSIGGTALSSRRCFQRGAACAGTPPGSRGQGAPPAVRQALPSSPCSFWARTRKS